MNDYAPPPPGAVPMGDYSLHGAELLDDLRATVIRFCALPSPEHTDAVVLWIAATHCLPAFDYAPRLVVRSAEKRSGKSRLLEVIDGTCHRPLRAAHATVAAIFRSLVGEHPPTLLLDEADTIFGSKKVAEDNEPLRGLLNAGHQRGMPMLRTVGPLHEVKPFETFTMAALAGIGKMPDTIEDRAVVIPMRRRKPSEQIEPFRLRRDKPALEMVRVRLAEWATDQVDALADADPDLPVEDRAADTWAPLVAVADAAGGHWPDRARKAARVLTKDAEADDAVGSLNIRLLADIRDVFAKVGAPFVKSDVLCEHLHRVEESPWKDFDLNPRKLSYRLREYGIKTKHNSSGSGRGYRLEAFTDAFERYLAPPKPDPRKEPSEGVKAPGLQAKTSDGYDSSDGYDPSEASEPSDDNRRDCSELTPSDGYGRGGGQKPAICRHGVENGDQPDLFVGGRLSCTECRAAEAMA